MFKNVNIKIRPPAHWSVGYDYLLLWVSFFLLGFGIIMVFSASIATADANNQIYYYLIRQSVFVFLGILSGIIAFKIPLTFWDSISGKLFIGGIVLLVIVLVVGKDVKGSKRWISLGFFNIQPSELVKLFTVFYASNYIVRKAHAMDSIKEGFLPLSIAVGGVGALLLMEPDFGALTVIAAIALGILFLGGMNGRLFGALMGVLIVVFIGIALFSPYRRDRLLGFMNPWSDPYGKGYQLSHALIAFGRGEWFGVGLGGSVEKLFYLPEAHTDFLLAVVAEELGFIGVAGVILTFVWLIWRMIKIGRDAISYELYFAGFTAQGIAIWFGVQSIINMGVNMGLLPTKGLTLPLLSFGGSSIVVNCMALGIILKIDHEVRKARIKKAKLKQV